LIKAQAALVACQAEVLKIEQDMMWTEREMWEKEREMFGDEGEEGGPPRPPSVRLPEMRDGSHTPKPPRQAMANAPRDPRGPREPAAPTAGPVAAIGPGPNGFRPTRGLSKYPSETTLYMPGDYPPPTPSYSTVKKPPPDLNLHRTRPPSSKNPHRHSYH